MAKREKLDELIIANEENALELVTANKEVASQNDEKGKHVAELIVANKENALALVTANKLIATQNEEIKKRAAELIIAYKELASQNKEKEKRAAELIITRKELGFQAELVIANKELVFQNDEKEKRAAELIIANKELAYQNDEKEKRADELIIANKELVFQNEEKTKRAEELTIAHKELEQLVQLNNDKNLFISILAHDLRSPLGVLLGLSDLLTENIRQFNIDKIEKLVNEINQSAQNTFTLLQDLLKWSRVQSGKIPFEPQNLSFKYICKDIIKILNPNAVAKNITINYSGAEEINVFADVDMLKAVLRNLVSNAIKFTNNGGAININTEVNSGNVTISVSDNGIGIEPESLTKLFDISKIHTTTGTAKEKGTGLGLLLCKEFVEKHGGKIWVESECGKGSIFYFNIPYNVESKGGNVLLTNSEDNRIKNLKILIVDDNELLRIILYEMVKKFCKEFLNAKTGVEAIAACHDNPDIDLILMDYLMPEMDGYEATRQIRLFNKEVVIIVQTAYVLSNENEMAIEAGCNDCISKPINKTLLYELINKHCNK
jgi:signal transduction histidine kinase/CheY-like chemotaxis protein